ncbi:hypothetical protein [Actinomyces bowdenii]|uniref:Cell division protein FtsL n=1 Tax=Actinomyces bowdenii TaxID=131109 RepID=A0A3P1V7R9_9ACTO|nr:hypothetical protein [Actinomyces bowdenii]RRD29395.1 hypothetical protein EII10_06080 [Actinomyces bowdenii]
MSATATARAARPAAARRTATSWSGAAAGAGARARGQAPASRPDLRVIRAAAPARSTLPFLAMNIIILAGALVASMLLNAQMASTAYRMKEVQVEVNIMNDHVETLRTQVQEASAPDTLAAKAAELGMVPAGAPGVVDLNGNRLTNGTAAQAG